MPENSAKTFQQAARELRAHLHKSQPSMATFLGLSLAALRTYERGAVASPDARAATAYMLSAEFAGLLDLVEVFGSELRRATGIQERTFASAAEYLASIRAEYSGSGTLTLYLGAVNHFEKRMVTALLACVRGQGFFKKYQESVFQALTKPYLQIDAVPESLRFLPKEELEDQLKNFEQAWAKERQARTENTSE